MSRRTRREERLLAEQDTVAMRRAERLALEERDNRKKKIGPPSAEEREAAPPIRLRRQPRPGKPLQR